MDLQHALIAIFIVCTMGGLFAFLERLEFVRELAHYAGVRVTLACLVLAGLLLAWPEMRDYQEVYRAASATLVMQDAENKVIKAYTDIGIPGADEEIRNAEADYQRAVDDARKELQK
jgi:hypothetical protein